MTYTPATIWFIIAVMGIVTFLIRFSFIGLVGSRKMPEWLLRHLRYTPVAILPGLVAPLVIWPEATGGQPDAIRAMAALVTVVVGYWTKSVIWAIVSGSLVLIGLLNLVG